MDYLKEDSCCGSQDHDTAFSEYGLMYFYILNLYNIYIRIYNV